MLPGDHINLNGKQITFKAVNPNPKQSLGKADIAVCAISEVKNIKTGETQEAQQLL